MLPPIPYLLLLLSLSVPSSFSHSFIFNGFKGLNSTNITLNGVAEITGNGILKLTNVTSHLIGRGFYPDPIRFKNPITKTALSFSTSFVFSVVPQYIKLGGHGFAFTISPNKDLAGAQSTQYLGLVNVTNNGNTSNHMFAVEFDTVQDFEFSDIDDNHVGVNINRMTSVKSTRAGSFVDGDSTKQDLCIQSGEKIQAWIDYDAAKPELNITLSLFPKKPNTPIISFPVDLSPVFQDFMYVGFSASTGRLASSHYIFGWSFNMTGKAESLDLHLLSLPPFKKNQKDFRIWCSVSTSLALFITVIVVSVYVIKKLKNIDLVEDWEFDVGPHKYSYKELKGATKGFHEKELLGFGGSGKVYKGILPDSNTQIAVKRISQESKQGLTEFISEISTIGRLRHRNLVRLLGWCRRRCEFFLVYDFNANGSLDKYIYNNPKMILTWEQRFKIINDVSNGLLYLHEEWEQTVLHRDIKAGNVLLDSEFNGRLGDFGLAKLYDHGSSPCTTKVVGTLGYLAPELTRTGKPTTSSDVYAFGALLLEVVCGRKPIEPKASPEELFLVDWIWEKWREGGLLEVVDSRLKGVFDEVEVMVVLKLGLLCSSDEPSFRPSMKQVVRYLEGEVPLPKILAPPCEGGEKGGFVVEFDNYAPPLPLQKVKSWSVGYREGDVYLEVG
ncbi:L-type lectin-domain containing receptor kinase S.4-like [Cynara cardunculus var. scolymus]|uniref:L-type lectin-domain containing receptor kinase S.4-like n=1 Tax=Cynara cardunculus var. scolymus TaxID=59895 RepID=UPI000D629D9D|nr:L-type lectin-domain containing receptor kinase S.4-like [Cynara cardunculus var. scolymus]